LWTRLFDTFEVSSYCYPTYQTLSTSKIIWVGNPFRMEPNRISTNAASPGVVYCCGKVANPFVRHQFEILPAEGVALARGEIRERHFVRAANAGVHVVNLAGKSVWRESFDHRFRIEERPVDQLGSSPEDTVQLNGAGHDSFSFR
jgi:hypothetical protein